jgi:hypothetical protein
MILSISAPLKLELSVAVYPFTKTILDAVTLDFSYLRLLSAPPLLGRPSSKPI